MSRLQQAIAVAATAWVAMHVWFGATALGDHHEPALGLAALVLLPLLTLWAGSPLVRGPVALSTWAAALMAAGGVTVFLLVLPFLDTHGVRSYANWPAGGIGPLIAGLVIRRHRFLAILLAAASCVIIVAAVIRTGGADLAWSTSLSVPPVLWLGATSLVRWIQDRSAVAVVRLDRAAELALDEVRVLGQRTSQAQEDRDRLRMEVIPVLRRLKALDGPDPALLGECGALEARMRDDLRARAVLDGATQAHLRQARSRGSVVTVLDDRELPAAEDQTRLARDLLARALPELRGAQVTCRLAPEGMAVTLVAESGLAELARVAAVVRRRWPDAVADVDAGMLFVRLAAVPSSPV